MYEKLLIELETSINAGTRNIEGTHTLTELLDLIIKIKTIQMMDKSAGMLDESQKMIGNL